MDIGSVIKEQYKVIEHIGRGGMADVWSARDTRLRRLVAIKTIAKGLSADVDPVALFEKEAQTIAAMEHPHILPIYDFGEYEGSLYIVMRFVTGGSLEHLLRGGPMDVQDVVKMGDAIARALDYAHENNIIHLDLKPPNILLGTQQTPYLADFGLATVLDVEGRARNPGSGTLLYMAPEQIVAEVIDRRADIYSFTIMLYHMLTARLPFDGTAPLALMQLQTGRTIPDITHFAHNLPDSVNDILRHGTAQNPMDRPKSLIELMEQFRGVISPSSTMEFSAVALGLEDLGPGLNLRTQQFVNEGAQELLEAVDVYSRARQQWAGGQGRFTLGMSPFLLVSGYYQDARHYDLTIDEAGYQMMLRGALEYDIDTEYWWLKANDESRREVCLHTLRSMNIPARIRALDRLEGLRDDPTNPVIPRLIGQALEIEGNEEVQLTALRVLQNRARNMPRPQVKIKEAPNRWQQSMTRLGVQIITTTEWPELIYSAELDTLIAEYALETDVPRVAEYAARTIGRIRSLAAMEHIAEAQREGRRGALQALAFIRDEAPALPNVVSRQGRLYAWITNTARRLTDRPLEGILRFVLALLGGWIGMGELVYTTFRSQSLFTPQRWSNTIAMGLVFGLCLALTVFLADEFSRRLERFWQGWLRLLLFGALGYLMGTITWGAYTWMFLQYTPSWDMMRLVGSGLALGLVLSAMLNLRGLAAVAFTTLTAYLPIFVMHRSFYAGDYTSVTPAIPLGLVWGGVIGWLFRRRVPELAYSVHSVARPPGTGWRGQMRTMVDIPQWPSWARILLAGFGGAGFTALAWILIGRTYESFPVGGSSLTWDGVLAMFMASLLIGVLMSYASKVGPRLAFFAVALVSLLLMEYVGGRYFYDDAFRSITYMTWNLPMFNTIPFAPTPDLSIIYFDAQLNKSRNLILLIGFPTVLAFSLGAYALLLWRDTWYYVGSPRAAYERGSWLTGILVYGLVATVAIGVFGLFSMHISIPWGLAWSAWGFVSWLCLVATWRWARWGAQGVIVSVIALFMGGIVADLFERQLALQAGAVPLLDQLMRITLHPGPGATLIDIVATAPVFWMLWAFGLVLSVRAVQQRKVWGYGVSVGLALVFVAAVALARVATPVGDTVAAVDGYNLLGLEWSGGVPSLAIRVSFLWSLWGLGILTMLYGVFYRQLWSGIGLVGLIIGWFVIVLFGGVGGSYTVLAAMHAALVLYALQPEWAKMEPNRFHWPWQGLSSSAGTLRLPAVPLTDAPAPPMLEPAVQNAGPTILRGQTPLPPTQPLPGTFLEESENLRTSVMPNMAAVANLSTELVVDEEAAAGANALKTDMMDTMATPSELPDLRTKADPQAGASNLPRIRLGQTGPLGQSNVPKIRLDGTPLDKNRMADTMPPVAVPPAGTPKDKAETETVEAYDLHNAQTQAVDPDLKQSLEEQRPTVEQQSIYNMPTQAVDPDLKPTIERPSIYNAPTQAVDPDLKQSLGDNKPTPEQPSIYNAPTQAVPPGLKPPSDAGPTVPKIKIGTGKLTLPPSEGGPNVPPKIKIGTGKLTLPPEMAETPPANESGPTVPPKIKLGGESGVSHPPLPGQTTPTGGQSVPGIKINLSSLSKPPASGQSSMPRIKLDAGDQPPSQPPTMPVPPDLKASLKKDDVEEGDFEELPPDKE